ncbi:hypothetical protein B1A_00258 [mine drainage metagenome]|uniref:Ribonuclease PIN domain-containing protein n=1 Tax=mine drainage metagenome TaxID=410659 RepID=T1CEQ5_9ZZZZ
MENLGTEEKEILVPDTSALLTGTVDLTDSRILIPSGVIVEIKRGKPARILLDHEPILKVVSPKEESIRQVKEAARSSGDLTYLSETDIEVLSVAFERKGIILTNDYSIQNVAKRMQINFKPCGIKPIDEEITWAFRCKGCRTIHKESIKECRICGHKVVRYKQVEQH